MAAEQEKPTDRIRVKHKDTGHHSTIARRTFDPERHDLLKSPAVTKWGTDVPPKFHTTVSPAKAAASKSAAKSAAAEPKPGGAAAEATDEEGSK